MCVRVASDCNIPSKVALGGPANPASTGILFFKPEPAFVPLKWKNRDAFFPPWIRCVTFSVQRVTEEE